MKRHPEQTPAERHAAWKELLGVYMPWMQLGDERYPNTIEATNRVLSLPMHPYLGGEEQQSIIDAVLEVL